MNDNNSNRNSDESTPSSSKNSSTNSSGDLEDALPIMMNKKSIPKLNPYEFDFELAKQKYDSLDKTLESVGVKFKNRDKDLSKEEAMKIVKKFREIDLPYPLYRFNITSDILCGYFEMLKNYKPNWIEKSHNELKGHPKGLWLPNRYLEKSWQLVNRKGTWHSIDILCDYFMEYERIHARKTYAPSMAEIWYNDDVLCKIIMKSYSNRNLTFSGLKENIFHSGREVVTFRMTKAKSLIQMILFRDTSGTTNLYTPFFPNEQLTDENGIIIEDRIVRENLCKGLKWLDMSSGWGDRMLTACALEMEYLGFDPNINLKYGYDQILEMFGTGAQKVIYKPFENCYSIVNEYTKIHGAFDISLISPPFFSIELYNGDGQSIDSYPKFEDWLVKFLFKSLFIIWDNLKSDGGYLAINIANINNCDIITPMQLFFEDVLHFSSWQGILTFSGRGTQELPGIVYVWRKVDPFISSGINNPRMRWCPNITRSFREDYPNLYKIWVEIEEVLIKEKIQ